MNYVRSCVHTKRKWQGEGALCCVPPPHSHRLAPLLPEAHFDQRADTWQGSGAENSAFCSPHLSGLYRDQTLTLGFRSHRSNGVSYERAERTKQQEQRTFPGHSFPPPCGEARSSLQRFNPLLPPPRANTVARIKYLFLGHLHSCAPIYCLGALTCDPVA